MTNWPGYECRLIRRGEVAVWFPKKASAGWRVHSIGESGSRPNFSDHPASGASASASSAVPRWSAKAEGWRDLTTRGAGDSPSGGARRRRASCAARRGLVLEIARSGASMGLCAGDGRGETRVRAPDADRGPSTAVHRRDRVSSFESTRLSSHAGSCTTPLDGGKEGTLDV